MSKAELEHNEYSIAIAGLPIGLYSYQFNLNDHFFSNFQHPDVEGGKVDVLVEMNKRSEAIGLNIHLTGTLKVECDRCLDLFDLKIKTSEDVVYTLGKNSDFAEDEVIILPKDQTIIDLSQLLYEIAVTQVPISKIHPNDSNGKSTCNPDMLKIIDQYKVKNEKENDNFLG